MLQFEELRLRLEASRPDIDDYADALGLASMRSQIQQLEKMLLTEFEHNGNSFISKVSSIWHRAP